MGSFSRGRRNSNGDRLIEFCTDNDMILTNTLFDHRASHRTTWAGHRVDQHGNKVPIYNQIDYVLVQRHHRARVTNARSFAGTTTWSDHRLVIMETTIRPRKFHKAPPIKAPPIKAPPIKAPPIKAPPIKAPPRFNTAKLTNEEERERYQQALDTNLSAPLHSWKEALQAVAKTAEDTIGTRPKVRTKYSSPTIVQLSEKQKDLRLLIYNTKIPEKRAKLQCERNKVLHELRKEAQKLTRDKENAKLEEIESVKDDAKMFKAIKDLARMGKHSPLLVLKDDKLVTQPDRAAEVIAAHFNGKFNACQVIDDNNNVIAYPQAIERGPLRRPISVEEVAAATTSLKNNRAAGPDNIPGELFKYGTTTLHSLIAGTLNEAFTSGEDLHLGEGTLIPLQKEGKPRGPLNNLRPIVLLTTLRKTLSTITLNRVRAPVEEFLAPTQSGFRQNRSTTDAVWAHKWLAATAQKQRRTIEILGLDMSSAFDTIDRGKLLEELRCIVGQDEWRMIQMLVGDTSLRVRFGNALSSPFTTTLGSPQGDSLSPVLFTVYLECALRQMRAACPRPQEDHLIPAEICYADDVDFPSTSHDYLVDVQKKSTDELLKWNLMVNETKLEWTELKRGTNKGDETWRHTKKLGSLLGDQQELKRRKQLAAAAFKKKWKVWGKDSQVSEKRRVRIYNAYVKPVLTYNMSTWTLTQADTRALDSFHRRQLRSVIGVHWPDKISNEELYRRTDTQPLSLDMFHARWRMFGHTLRMSDEVPAKQAMLRYFDSSVSLDAAGRTGRPRTTLPILLSQELKLLKDAAQERSVAARTSNRIRTKKEREADTERDKIYAELPRELKTTSDLRRLERLATTRRRWQTFVNDAYALYKQRDKDK